MVLWCAARDWAVSEGAPIYHDQRLTRPGQRHPGRRPATRPAGAYAIVQVDDDRPVVYPDITTDEGYWYQVRAVDIVCPNGHRLTWLDDASLLDDHGQDTTIAAVFGPDRQMPYSECRDCAKFDDGDTDTMCDCGDTSAIYCPTCNRSCRLTLTDVPTYPQPGEVHQ